MYQACRIILIIAVFISLSSVCLAAIPLASLAFEDSDSVAEGLELANTSAEGDGPVEVTDGVLVTMKNNFSNVRYAYFKVDDDILFDLPQDTVVTVKVGVKDDFKGYMMCQYDSHVKGAPVEGAYSEAKAARLTGTGGWITVTFEFKKARLANRQNGAADFRISVNGKDFVIRKVEVYE